MWPLEFHLLPTEKLARGGSAELHRNGNIKLSNLRDYGRILVPGRVAHKSETIKPVCATEHPAIPAAASSQAAPRTTETDYGIAEYIYTT